MYYFVSTTQECKTLTDGPLHRYPAEQTLNLVDIWSVYKHGARTKKQISKNIFNKIKHGIYPSRQKYIYADREID